MRALIQARSTMGNSQLWRAGRPWPVDEAKEVEVLDQEEDPPVIEVDVKNSTTGLMQKETRPDPDRMGQASYRAILADKRLRIIQTDAVNGAAVDAQIAAARASAARAAEALVDAEGQIGKLKAELEEATSDLKEAKALVEELGEANEKLQAELEEATKPAPTVVPAKPTEGGA